jgi:phosphoglycolate phosphatase
LVQQQLGVAPHEVLYVGDSGIDMQTARNAGFAAVGVLWGFRDREELVEHGARWLVATPAAILPIYTGERPG